MKLHGYLVFISTVLFAKLVLGAPNENGVWLSDHEPNLVGYTYDDDDKEPFLDFKISLEYPLARESLNGLVGKPWFPNTIKSLCNNKWLTDCYPYFAFTGRFGQYIGQRDSSPVIAKRFNPKLFLRFRGRGDDYLDVEYAHESNGQRISTQESYDALADDLASHGGGKRSHANDYISRGWDYVGLTYKHSWSSAAGGSRKFSTYVSYRNYIDGYLQGDIEEYFDWEPRRDITARKEVSGFQVIAKLHDKQQPLFLNINKVALIYETGTSAPAEHNTVMLELTTNSIGVPIMFWARTGYNSDLAQYYEYVTSYGIAFELRTFQ